MSKSDDELGVNDDDFRIEVLQWLHNVFHSNQHDESKKNVFDNLDAKLKQLSKLCHKSNVKLSVSDFNKDCAQDTFKSISEHANDLSFFQNRLYTEVYRAEVIPFKGADANERKDVIKDWLNKIPLKSHDFLERPVEREPILNSIANKLKDISATTPENVKNKLKSEVIDMLNEMPIDMKGSNNKRSYLNAIASSLIDRLNSTNVRNKVNPKSVYCNIPNHVQFKFDIQPTENELKAFINDELADFFEKSRLEISNQRIQQIETEIFDILINGIAAIRSNQDENVIAEIVTLLKQSAGLFEHQAMYITNLLLDHLRQMMINVTEQPQVRSIPNRLETVMTIQNSTMNSFNDSSIAGITEGDLEANLNYYIEQLSQQIDEWLTGLHVLKTQEQSFRQVVVNDLAGDIVDRHKYLELNPSSRGTDEEELEHLKFQIFKWINKLVGENHTDTIEHAPDLMRRIRSVPIPMLTRPGVGYNTSYRPGNVSQMPMFGPLGSGGSMVENRQRSAVQGRLSGPGGYASGPMHDSVNVSQLPMFGPTGPGGSMMEQQRMAASGRSSSPGAMGIPASPDSQNQSVHPPKTMQELNDEFDDFVKRWVQEIPIAATSPEEQELLPSVREGLYNGVWKAITKLKCQPDLLYNPFYFEDKLDDEIEALFDMLPQSSEFGFNRHKLKVKLIEKTSYINDQIKNAARSESFKQRLIDNLDIYIPRLKTDEANEDPIRLHEELEILYLAEEYILYRRFKNEDPVKAAVYRNKLLKMVHDLVQEVKRSHGREMKDINPDLYANDIITALQQVPLPSDETIQQEADQILLGLEIERWYADLPIARNNDTGEQLKRRRLRDALGRKIYEMERSMDFSDSNSERVLKHEVSRFLERVPLGRNETMNINFLVDELANRLKNRPRAPGADKKNILDENTVHYQNFSRNVESCQDKCSSRIDKAVADFSHNLSAQLNQSGYQPNTSVQSPGGYTVFDRHRPFSSSLNALPGEAQYYSQQQAEMSPGQAYMLPSVAADQSGPWMSLYETGTGPGLGIQNITGAQQPIPIAALQSFGSYPNYSSVQPPAPNSTVQGPMGQRFDEERPVSSTFNPQTGSVEYFSIPGSSGQPIHGAGQASMVPPGQNISVHAPQVSLQSPAQAISRNMSAQQWFSLYHTGSLPADQSMARPSISVQGRSMRQEGPAQQSFREATIPNNSFFPPPNTIVQSPLGYQSFNQERPISSSFNPQDSGIQNISMLPASSQGQASMMQPGMSVQGQSILANQTPQISRGATPQEILQASHANAGIGPNVSIGPMGTSLRAPTMNAGIGTTGMRMRGPAQGLSTSLPPRYGEEPKPHVSFRVADYNRSVRPGPGLPPFGTLSSYEQPPVDFSTPLGQPPVGFSTPHGQPPVGFSTPQQGVIPGSPPGLRRRQMREGQIPQRDSVRKRLDLEDEEDIGEVPCRCMERLKRYRKRMRFPCPSYEMDFRQRPSRCYNPYYL